MATFHSGSEGQTQKLQALRRRQKRLAFRAVIVRLSAGGFALPVRRGGFRR